MKAILFLRRGAETTTTTTTTTITTATATTTTTAATTTTTTTATATTTTTTTTAITNEQTVGFTDYMLEWIQYHSSPMLQRSGGAACL